MKYIIKILFVVCACWVLGGCEAIYLANKVINAPQKIYQPTISNPNETATLTVIAQNAIGITVYPNASCVSSDNPEKRKISGGLVQSLRSFAKGPEPYTFKVNANRPITVQMGFGTDTARCSGDITTSFVPKLNSVYEAFLELDWDKRQCIMKLNEVVGEQITPVAIKSVGECTSK